MVFVVTAIMNFVVVALALFVLKPMRAQADDAEPDDPTSADLLQARELRVLAPVPAPAARLPRKPIKCVISALA